MNIYFQSCMGNSGNFLIKANGLYASFLEVFCNPFVPNLGLLLSEMVPPIAHFALPDEFLIHWILLSLSHDLAKVVNVKVIIQFQNPILCQVLPQELYHISDDGNKILLHVLIPDDFHVGVIFSFVAALK